MRKRNDIGRARATAQTEIKFKELYEDHIPKEFDLLPDPTKVFEEEKAIEEIVENFEKENGCNASMSQINLSLNVS